MTVNVTKPAVDVRQKLAELDYGTIPYEKMPLGSCIGSAFYFSSYNGTGDTTVSSGDQNSSGYVVDPAFTYYKRDPNSFLYVEYKYSIVRPKGYIRETIHFDHTEEDKWASDVGGYITSGGATQNGSSADLTEHKDAAGIIAGYVIGPGVSSGFTQSSSSPYYYNNKSFGGFVHSYSNYCSFALALASSDNFIIRDDIYFSTKAMVLEFKR